MSSVFILENVPLAPYSTMRLGGMAAYLTEVSSRQETIEAVQWADEHAVPVMMIGSGSNIIWQDDGYPGLVIINKIQGFEVQEQYDDRYITVGSGYNWDEFVARTVQLGMTGIECLSLVPGTVGGTPVQNVGAYGQEISQTVITIEAYDHQTKQIVNLRASECGFGYRTSIFKTSAKGRYFMTAITFFLTIGKPALPYYDTVQRYLTEHSISDITPQVMRDAVIVIRRAKLPDPTIVANCGSFFGNPIINSDQFFELHADYPEISYWNTDDNRIKLSAAWLIEQTGFKDVHDAETGMATWPTQPLVLVNEYAESTAQLLTFKQKIVDAVQAKFRITLEQEPELI